MQMPRGSSAREKCRERLLLGVEARELQPAGCTAGSPMPSIYGAHLRRCRHKKPSAMKTRRRLGFQVTMTEQYSRVGGDTARLNQFLVDLYEEARLCVNVMYRADCNYSQYVNDEAIGVMYKFYLKLDKVVHGQAGIFATIKKIYKLHKEYVPMPVRLWKYIYHILYEVENAGSSVPLKHPYQGPPSFAGYLSEYLAESKEATQSANVKVKESTNVKVKLSTSDELKLKEGAVKLKGAKALQSETMNEVVGSKASAKEVTKEDAKPKAKKAKEAPQDGANAYESADEGSLDLSVKEFVELETSATKVIQEDPRTKAKKAKEGPQDGSDPNAVVVEVSQGLSVEELVESDKDAEQQGAEPKGVEANEATHASDPNLVESEVLLPKAVEQQGAEPKGVEANEATHAKQDGVQSESIATVKEVAVTMMGKPQGAAEESTKTNTAVVLASEVAAVSAVAGEVGGSSEDLKVRLEASKQEQHDAENNLMLLRVKVSERLQAAKDEFVKRRNDKRLVEDDLLVHKRQIEDDLRKKEREAEDECTITGKEVVKSSTEQDTLHNELKAQLEACEHAENDSAQKWKLLKINLQEELDAAKRELLKRREDKRLLEDKLLSRDRQIEDDLRRKKREDEDEHTSKH